MYPVLFTIGDISIFSLGTFMVIGFIVFNIIIIALSHRKKLNIKFWNSHIVSLVIITIVGARTLYILTNIDRFQQNWSEIFLPDGFSFYGGGIAFLILLYFYAKKHKENFLLWTDIFTVSFFSWLFFSAIGHFLDGSNFGIPTDLPWGITFDSILSPVIYIVPIHPTQLYEALYAAVIFFFLLHLLTRSRITGVITFLGGFLLGTCDFFLNYLLGDTTTMIGSLRLEQVIDLFFIAICGGLLLSIFVKKQEK